MLALSHDHSHSTAAISARQSQAFTLFSTTHQLPRSATHKCQRWPSFPKASAGQLHTPGLLASSSHVPAVQIPTITLNSRCCRQLPTRVRRPSAHRAANGSSSSLMMFPVRGPPGLAWWPWLHQFAAACSQTARASVGERDPQAHCAQLS